MIARAADAGVQRMLVAGWDVPSSVAAVELAVRHPGVVDAAVGIHPHNAVDADERSWETLAELTGERGVLAVGEIGLDFHRHHSPRDVQRDVLARQLDLAARRSLPVVVHDRDAHAEVTATLLAWRPSIGRDVAGILHCFSGDAEMATTLAAAGFLVSFALPVSFSSAHQQRRAAALLPGGSFVTETDSPWLGPGRDRRNEPTTVLRVAAELAHLRGVDIDQIAGEVARAYARVGT
ncbi:MAG: TatD family hydrolase [Chloroflexota bacterium]|nr:TatD family hydrolase [Chloroflexota bacterium]